MIWGVMAGDPLPLPAEAQPGDEVALAQGAQLRPLVFQTGPKGHLRVAGESAIGSVGEPIVHLGAVEVQRAGAAPARLSVLHLPDSDQHVVAPAPNMSRGVTHVILRSCPPPEAHPAPTPRFSALLRGTPVERADGQVVPVEDLAPGTALRGIDGDDVQLRWCGTLSVTTDAETAPVVMEPGAIGNDATLLISPDTRILLEDWRAEVMCGSRQVLVAARDLVDGQAIRRRAPGHAQYYLLLCDRHQIIRAAGAWIDSLRVTTASFAALREDHRAEVLRIFPNITQQPPASLHTRRIALATTQAQALLHQIGLR